MKQNNIKNIYKNFSEPMINIALDSSQRNKAIIMSKVLWVLLITEHDSEEQIYTELEKIIPDHDAIIAMGSVYFNKMKANLTKKEIKNIKKHYSDTKNFDNLSHWIDEENNEVH